MPSDTTWGPYVHPLEMSEGEFETWHKRIRRGIGGYDICALMGVHGSPFDVYAKMLDMAERQEPTRPMLRGRALEDDALNLFAEATGLTVQPFVGDDMFVRHPENKFLVAQMDAAIVPDGETITAEMGPGLVDAKVPATFFFSEYVTDGIPEQNYMQLQWQLGLKGYSWGTFAVLDYENWRTLGGERPPMIEADPELFAEMRDRAETFLADHFFKREAPPEDVAADDSPFTMPTIGNEETRVTDHQHIALLTRFFAARERRKLGEHEEKKIRERIEELFGEYDTGVMVLDHRKISWQPGTRRTFNQGRAKSTLMQHGEDIDAFYDIKPTRAFRPTGD